MKAVEKLGEFLVQYQHYVEIALLAVLAVLILFLLIRAIVKDKKEKKLLTEISSAVSDINDTVHCINDKQPEESVPGSISVTGENPSVKVSYLVKNDEQDALPVVQISGEAVNKDFGASETADDGAEKCEATAQVAGEQTKAEVPAESEEDCDLDALLRQMAEIKAGKARQEEKPADITIEQGVPRVIFESRNCATDKHGKIYTEEELSEQIK